MKKESASVGGSKAVIVGVGVDLVEVARMAQMVIKRGSSAIRKALREEEIEQLGQVHPKQSVAFAVHWGVKEAVSKALGAGLARGFDWRDIGLEAGADGQWEAQLYGGAAKRAAELGVGRMVVAFAARRQAVVVIAVALAQEGGEDYNLKMTISEQESNERI